MSIKISIPSLSDFLEIADLVSKCDGLVGHDPHFYKIVLEYFGVTSLVTKDSEGRIVGFTFGIISQKDPKLFFLWQIGVQRERMKEGIGKKLLLRLIDSARKKGCSRMRVTVVKENLASKLLFEGADFKNVSNPYNDAAVDGDGSHMPNFYGESEDLVIYERDI